MLARNGIIREKIAITRHHLLLAGRALLALAERLMQLTAAGRTTGAET
jgi:hypothetical protein